MKIRAYAVRVIVGVDPVYTFLTTVEPIGILWGSYHRSESPPPRGVVFVAAEDTFDFTQISGLPSTIELPANNLDTAWNAVLAARRTGLKNVFEAEHGPFDSSGFSNWEDGIVSFLNRIGHPQEKLRSSPVGRSQAFIEAFE